MKKIVTNSKTLAIAIIGIVGGVIWGFMTNWEPEPIILLAVSVIEIIAFIILGYTDNNEDTQPQVVTSTITQGNVSVNVNVGSSMNANEGKAPEKSEKSLDDREARIEYMKSKTRILFIDDDKKFNVVKILKDSGWIHTKSIVDVKSIDSPQIRDAQIHFVDINGVGKLLNLPSEGLDLALMIKQRFPYKKVILYSANRNSNSFHEAWDLCDFKLEKNALPNQFLNIVEQCSLQFYNTTE